MAILGGCIVICYLSEKNHGDDDVAVVVISYDRSWAEMSEKWDLIRHLEALTMPMIKFCEFVYSGTTNHLETPSIMASKQTNYLSFTRHERLLLLCLSLERMENPRRSWQVTASDEADNLLVSQPQESMKTPLPAASTLNSTPMAVIRIDLCCALANLRLYCRGSNWQRKGACISKSMFMLVWIQNAD
jgi:hypothetical protein